MISDGKAEYAYEQRRRVQYTYFLELFTAPFVCGTREAPVVQHSDGPKRTKGQGGSKQVRRKTVTSTD